MKTIRVGDRVLGSGEKCFIAAEIGINHNGSLQLAHEMIEAAAVAGVDAVKFQNYRTDDFITDRSLKYEYVSEGRTVLESQYAMFQRYELPASALTELREHCDRLGIVFFSTPTSAQGITELVNAGCTLLKNGSDYLVHLPLIRAMASSGLPTVLSTGMATLSEIDEAVRAFREADGKDMILLHCTSSYPTPSEDVHLRKIPALAAAFDCLVGFSDHTEGVTAAIGAVVLGACFIEKHFTLDKQQPGPDHRFSADPVELEALVENIREVEKNLRDTAIGPTPSEELGRRDFRLSCVAVKDLKAGHCLQEFDVAFRRPATGLPPRALDGLVFRRLKRDLSAGGIILWEDLQ